MMMGCFGFIPTDKAQPFWKDSWGAYQRASSLQTGISNFYLPCMEGEGGLSKAQSSLLASRHLLFTWFLRLWIQAAPVLANACKGERGAD